MRITIATYYIGFVLGMVGLFMLLSSLIGLIYHDGSFSILAESGLLVIGFGLFPLIFIPRKQTLTIREAIFVVSGGWIFTVFAGSIPYYLYGQPFTFVNAIFESASGFTTTGSSILVIVEEIPKGLLFWRSMTHWIGGVGIIVLALAVLPTMSTVSRSLFRQEYSGIGNTTLFPRARDIARVVLIVYVGLTFLETAMLMLVKVDLFEAVTTAFGTIATGGFSPRNNSIASYNSFPVELIVFVFMIISGINFGYIYTILFSRKKLYSGWETARFYLLITLISIIIVALSIKNSSYPDWASAFRYAGFQVASIGSSSGFASADSSIWSAPAQFVLIILALVCASAGSTSGGIKIDRIAIFLKLMALRLKQVIHPNIVPTLHFENRAVDSEFADKAVFYIMLYLAVVSSATLLLTLTGVNLLESFTGTVASMGNVGPGFGKIGSLGNYSALPSLAKLILCVVMLLGRLEIFILILPLTRYFWRK